MTRAMWWELARGLVAAVSAAARKTRRAAAPPRSSEDVCDMEQLTNERAAAEAALRRKWTRWL